MSMPTPTPTEFRPTHSSAELPATQSGFDLTLARPFIYKSVSDETRSAYRRTICEFFQSVGNSHPAQVTPAHVIAYRDRLRTAHRKPNTIATKLAIVRS